MLGLIVFALSALIMFFILTLINPTNVMVNVVGSVVLGFIFMVLNGLYAASQIVKDIARNERDSDADRRYQERRDRERYEKERYDRERRERERREREYY
jgi:hypothetical protein